MKYTGQTCMPMLYQGLSGETVSDTLGVNIHKVYRYKDGYKKSDAASFPDHHYPDEGCKSDSYAGAERYYAGIVDYFQQVGCCFAEKYYFCCIQ